MLTEHKNNQSIVMGVILAGGLARRMNNQDKGFFGLLNTCSGLLAVK